MNAKSILAGKTAYIIVSEGRILPTRTIIKKCKIIAANKKGGEAVVILDGTEIEFFVPPRKLYRTRKDAYTGLVEYLRDTERNEKYAIGVEK